MLVFDKPSISKNSQVLLVKKKDAWINTADGRSFFRESKWGFPGGRPRVPAEPEADNATREVWEETGVLIKLFPDTRVQMGSKFVKIGRAGYCVGGELSPNPREIVECDWYPVNVIQSNCLDFYKWHRHMALLLLKQLSQQRLTQFR